MKVKDSSQSVQFSEKNLWKHKDGSMELISTMPTKKLQVLFYLRFRKD